MSPLAAELTDTLRQIGPASMSEVIADFEARARMGLAAHAERMAIDEAWSEASRAGRIKLTGGEWHWIPERAAVATAATTNKQKSLF